MTWAENKRAPTTGALLSPRGRISANAGVWSRALGTVVGVQCLARSDVRIFLAAVSWLSDDALSKSTPFSLHIEGLVAFNAHLYF